MPVTNDSVETSPVILIVDDDPDSAEVLVELLRLRGARTVCTYSAAEARSVLATDDARVDVMVTDYSMPNEDGLSLIARVRSMPRWASLPVVMVSGHDLIGEIASAAHALGAEFVPKPIDFDAIMRAVGRALGRSELTPQL